MSSKIDNRKFKTAAWRISFWGAITFAIGTALVFLFLHRFLAHDLQKRTDSWLVGELAVLGDVAQRTPDSQLHNVIIEEVAELASREAPSEIESIDRGNHAVFFLLTDLANRPLLHTGSGSPELLIPAILRNQTTGSGPRNVSLPGFDVPFRVAQMELPKNEHIYLGFSTHYERAVLNRLRTQFLMLWCLMILLGGSIVFVTTNRMLQRVLAVSDTAAQIGRNNMATRVPVSDRNDEISQLSITFNQMLDRVQTTVQQLHTMTDAIAHDIRSPITAIRCRLELALIDENDCPKDELLALTIEELDRLIGMLTMSLDVSEAGANALRLRKERIEFHKLIQSLVELYEPAFNDAGLSISMGRDTPVTTSGDSALLQRAVTNLFDNEIKHLPSASTVAISVFENENMCFLEIEDDGPGFSEELLPSVFEPYVRSKSSNGHGLGLAFVAATIRSHGGEIMATNRDTGGARIVVRLPTLSF